MALEVVVNISSSKNESKSQPPTTYTILTLVVVNISSSKNESKSQQVLVKFLLTKRCCKYQ